MDVQLSPHYSLPGFSLCAAESPASPWVSDGHTEAAVDKLKGRVGLETAPSEAVKRMVQ